MNLLGWSDQDNIKKDYYNICDSICNDEKLFNNFKILPEYTTILEHVDYELGAKYLNIIMSNYPTNLINLVLKNLNEIKQNDIYGNPVKYDYHLFGLISPTTIRYIKVLLDILFLGFDLNNKKIVEIGGGYGGQSLILSKFFNFESYTILDLESASKLQNKYISINGVSNIKSTTIENIKELNSDFIMSNYAFSELNKEYQDLYMEKIIKNSKSGFFQINPDASECYNAEELKNIFSKFTNPKFLLDSPMNERYPNNFIFAYGLENE